MTKFYRLYSAHRDFHVTTHDDATILDACRAVEHTHGVIVQGVQIHRSEPRPHEEVVIV